jgi:uncharacterized protein (TIGR03067 family)
MKEEQKKLLGTWSLVSEVDSGKERPANQVKNIKLTFEEDGKWKVTNDGKVAYEGTFVVDPARKPKSIDYTFTAGQPKGSKFTAIYEVEEDSFKHCGVSKGQRPTEFESKPGSKQILTIFKRDK